MAHHEEMPEWDPDFLEFKKSLDLDVKATFHSFRSHIDQLTTVTQVILKLLFIDINMGYVNISFQ